jgi:hypothetical protein
MSDTLEIILIESIYQLMVERETRPWTNSLIISPSCGDIPKTMVRTEI